MRIRRRWRCGLRGVIDFMKIENANVMLDIETLGTNLDAVIVSIGAVRFGCGEEREFYRRIDLPSCEKLGRKVDVDTVLWWMRRDAVARAELTGDNERMPLEMALRELAAFMKPDDVVWGNAPSFDCVILRSAFRACGLECPWKFWNERCYRTMVNMFPDVKMERVGTYHNALDDARSQVSHLRRILTKLS